MIKQNGTNLVKPYNYTRPFPDTGPVLSDHWPAWYYDPARADVPVKFFRTYIPIYEGPNTGQPFELAPHQVLHIHEIYGRIDPRTGKRIIRSVFMSENKKWGKTTLLAGLGLLHITLLGDYHEEADIIANSIEQAGELFGAADAMIRVSCEDDQRRTALYKLFDYERDVNQTPSNRRINYMATNSFMRVIAAQKRNVHGPRPSFLAVDELHAFADRDAIDPLLEGQATRPEPIAFRISNMGEEGGSPVFWEEHAYAKGVLDGSIIDHTFYTDIAEAPAHIDDDALLEEGPHWIDLNPHMGPGGYADIADLRRACNEAKHKPMKRSNVLRLRLGRATRPTTRWLSLEKWKAAAVDPDDWPSWEDVAGFLCVAGADLSSVLDFTSAAIVWVDTSGTEPEFYSEEWVWVPAGLIKHIEGKIEQPLAAWVRDGHVVACPGNRIRQSMVMNTLIQSHRNHPINELDMDPAAAGADFVVKISDADITVVELRQNFGDLSAAALNFQSDIEAGRWHHLPNPCVDWQISNVEVLTNTADQIRPVKPDRRKSKFRVDTVQSLVMARAAYESILVNAPKPSVYANRGAVVI